ncbi:MAG: amidohydrolase family protein [Spirochaetes bacterium]|jgi:predicted TIM-barrel fold metal-dependent hydrolase|nr:amidohydrolase family protein [Spirochaetota bacterium]
MIIDVHAHIFPDKIASKAIGSLAANSGEYKPFGDGTLENLLVNMDRAGVDTAFVANIATKPQQFKPIIDWSVSIRSERIFPLGLVHPESPDFATEISSLVENGFCGVKLHPLYQDFYVDDKQIVPFFKELEQSGMFVLLHAGNDIAYPDADNASPVRIARLLDRVPSLDVIAAHMGGWEVWEQVSDDLAGANCWFDTSFITHIDKDLVCKIIEKQGTDRIVYGSDFPWQDQKDQIDYIRSIFSADDTQKILSGNILMLLKKHGCEQFLQF